MGLESGGRVQWAWFLSLPSCPVVTLVTAGLIGGSVRLPLLCGGVDVLTSTVVR